MRLFGKSTKSAVEHQGISLTRVRFTNEFARRTYTIERHTDIVFDYNNDSFNHDDTAYSMRNPSVHEQQESDVQESFEQTITNTESLRYTPRNAISDLTVEHQLLAQSVSDEGTAQEVRDGPASEDSGVVLLSLQRFNDDLPVQSTNSDGQNNSENTQDSCRQNISERQNSITQLHNNVNRSNIAPTRSTRGNNSRSYNIIQESHDNPSEEVISMRLTRSALSEELMSRPPPSYELIVELTDGAYIKPLPPAYDSIFQTNKM